MLSFISNMKIGIFRFLFSTFAQKAIDKRVQKILDEAGELIANELGMRKIKALFEEYVKAGGPERPKEELIMVRRSYSNGNIVIRLPVPRGIIYDAAVKEFTEREIARRYLNGDLRLECNGLFTAKDEGMTATVEMLELPPRKQNT